MKDQPEPTLAREAAAAAAASGNVVAMTPATALRRSCENDA